MESLRQPTTPTDSDQPTIVSTKDQVTCCRCWQIIPRAKADKRPWWAPRCVPCAQAQTEEIIAAKDARWAAHCPPLYRATDPARLDAARLKRVLAWQYGPRGLILTGPGGTGKTRCALLLVKRLVLDEGREACVFLGNQFAQACQTAWMDNGPAWSQRLNTVEVLFLDDLAKSKFTERVEAELFGIVEMRMANLLPTIITTNTVGGTLKSKLSADRGEPLIRRLRECCQCITFA